MLSAQPPRVLIVTALPVERAAVLRHVGNLRRSGTTQVRNMKSAAIYPGRYVSSKSRRAIRRQP